MCRFRLVVCVAWVTWFSTLLMKNQKSIRGVRTSSPNEARQPSNGHRIPDGHRVVAVSILAGLHHEYRLESLAA